MSAITNRTVVERIADAVLYEGYILYPYRPSAVKNQQRWNFGALCPQSYCEFQAGTERWTMQTECLVQPAGINTQLNVKVRFLHLVAREVCVSDADGAVRVVPALEVNGKLFQTWQEAVERDVCLPPISFEGAPIRFNFSFPESDASEFIHDDVENKTVGVIRRKQSEIDGAVEVITTRLPNDLVKVNIQILNLTALENPAEVSRDQAMMRSLVSTHTILTVENWAFVSLLDPPEMFREAAAGCSNVGTYPVLVGAKGERNCMLSSPIILYDYPQIAPESAGNLYDGTEIDEILTLRIMTLTDEEKREMRAADNRGRQILERTELMPAEQFMKMHGAMKAVKGRE